MNDRAMRARVDAARKGGNEVHELLDEFSRNGHETSARTLEAIDDMAAAVDFRLNSPPDRLACLHPWAVVWCLLGISMAILVAVSCLAWS